MTYAETAEIFIMPDRLQGHPEVASMIGAMFSRSYRPMRERVAELDVDAPDQMRAKIAQYVVGYGHDSILDMANVMIAIEGIPITAAIALEDHPLFSGQETSTRMVDWSVERFEPSIDAGHAAYPAVQRVLRHLRETYVRVQRGVLERLQWANPIAPDDPDRALRERAMRARSFDVARGFLPACAVTRVCWSMRLSAGKQHLRDLMIHPDPNVVRLAERIWDALHERFPGAVPARDVGTASRSALQLTRWRVLRTLPHHRYSAGCIVQGSIITSELVTDTLRDRGWCEPIPDRAFLGRPPITLSGYLDLGSLRDLHRHRRGVHAFEIPSRVQYHHWYLDQAEGTIDADTTAREITRLRESVVAEADNWAVTLSHTDVNALVPLMTVCPVEYQMDVPQLVYLLERRSTTDVHPTLRAFVQEAHRSIIATSDPGFPMHVDVRPDPGRDGYVLTRGRQTILVNGRELSHHEERAS